MISPLCFLKVKHFVTILKRINDINGIIIINNIKNSSIRLCFMYNTYVCLYIICSKTNTSDIRLFIGTVSHSCSQMDKFGLVNTKQINAIQLKYKKTKIINF